MHDIYAFTLMLTQGIWTAKTIANPDYFEDKEPYKMSPIVSLMEFFIGDKTKIG